MRCVVPYSAPPVALSSLGREFFGMSLPSHPTVDRYLSEYRSQPKLKELFLKKKDVSQIIETIFFEEGIPPDLVALALLESGLRIDAKSGRGALGLWQFIPSTARKYGLVIKGKVDERKDVKKSTRAAARYLRDLFETFDSWPLALAAFNCGSGYIERAVKLHRTVDFFELVRRGAIHDETAKLVPRVMALAQLRREWSGVPTAQAPALRNS